MGSNAKSKEFFRSDVIAFTNKRASVVTKRSNDDDTGKKEYATIEFNKDYDKKYSVCEISKSKQHKSYKENNTIKYVTTDYTIKSGDDTFYFIPTSDSFKVYSDDEGKYVNFIVKCITSDYMFPIYAIKTKKELYLVLNTPLENDVTREIVPNENGVVRAQGNCNILKIDLESKEHSIIHQSTDKRMKYSLVVRPNSKGEPNIILFSPKVSSNNKNLPKSLKGLLIKHLTDDVEPEYKSAQNLLAINLINKENFDLLMEQGFKLLGIKKVSAPVDSKLLNIK